MVPWSDPPVSIARSGPTQRIVLIEALRPVAMLEIIAFHLFGRLPVLNGLGLPIFLRLSVTFSVAGVERHGMRRVTLGKVRGIGLRHGVLPSEVFNARMFLYGTSGHLWFCPFIIVAGAAVALLHRSTRGHTGRWKSGATLIIAFGCLLVASSEGVIGWLGARAFPPPIWAWYVSSPSLLLGLAMGQVLLRSREDPLRMVGLALLALLGVDLVHVIIGRIAYWFLSDHPLPWPIVVYALSLGLVAWMRGTRLRPLVQA